MAAAASVDIPVPDSLKGIFDVPDKYKQCNTMEEFNDFCLDAKTGGVFERGFSRDPKKLSFWKMGSEIANRVTSGSACSDGHAQKVCDLIQGNELFFQQCSDQQILHLSQVLRAYLVRVEKQILSLSNDRIQIVPDSGEQSDFDRFSNSHRLYNLAIDVISKNVELR